MLPLSLTKDSVNILSFDLNNVLADVEAELVRRGHTLLPLDGKKETWKKADVIVVWQESPLGGWRETIEMWQKAGKRVVLVQHGRRGISRIYPPFNEKLISDAVCVWGENDVTRLMSSGVPLEKIHITGTPILRHIKPRIPHKGVNVVFSPEHWDVEVPENFAVRNALRDFVASKWPWQIKPHIITKIIAGEHHPMDYDNPVTSNRQAPGHLDVCVDTLRIADVVVAISDSTFELLAQAMNIPVVIADIWVPKACSGDPKYKEYQREYSPACEKVQDLSKLGDVIMKYAENPSLLEHERAEIAMMDGGIHIEDPVDELIKVIVGNETNNRRPVQTESSTTRRRVR